MGIKIYTEANNAASVSSEDAFTKPLLIAMNGKTGGVLQKRIYVRNDELTKSYQGITVKPFSSYPAFINGTNGMSWKLYAGDIKPTDEVWATISNANTITLPDLGTISTSDISTYLPFWVKVVIPRSTDAQTIKDVKLQISATETLI